MIISFKLHSTIDVITNSSSELFVCDTTKSLEFVNEFLKNILDVYNSGNDTHYQFDDVYGDVYTVNEENFDEFFKSVVIDWDFKRWNWEVSEMKEYSDFINEYKAEHNLETKYPYDKFKDYNKDAAEKVNKAWDEHVELWSVANKQIVKDSAIGNIVIKSADENSIPFALFDLIEHTFNGDRLHLG